MTPEERLARLEDELLAVEKALLEVKKHVQLLLQDEPRLIKFGDELVKLKKEVGAFQNMEYTSRMNQFQGRFAAIEEALGKLAERVEKLEEKK